MPTHIIFGDVHGQADQLERLLIRARTQHPDCQLVTLGDLIDRGPSAPRVMDLCIQYGVTGIYGNHAGWLKDVLAGADLPEGVKSSIMGGTATIRSYEVDTNDYPSKIGYNLRKRVPKAHAAFLKTLTLTRTLTHITATGAPTTYFLTHAGINHTLVASLLQRLAGANPSLSDGQLLEVLGKVAEAELLWSSPDVFGDRIANSLGAGMFRFPGGAVQVFGHRPLPAPICEPGWFYAMDTGCGTCAPKLLSALVLQDGNPPVTFSVQ